MKANDLMLGDTIGYLPTWINEEDGTIQIEGDPNNPIPCKVEGLGYDSAILTNGEDSFDVSEIELYPIPLTAEILEKNGWAHYEDDKDSFYGKDCVFLNQKDGGYGVCIDNVRTISGAIHYIHELQHALRLCGIEKEVVLLIPNK